MIDDNCSLATDRPNIESLKARKRAGKQEETPSYQVSRRYKDKRCWTYVDTDSIRLLGRSLPKERRPVKDPTNQRLRKGGE